MPQLHQQPLGAYMSIKLQTVTLSVSDIERSLRFYRDLLGFRVIDQLPKQNSISRTQLDIGNGHILNLDHADGPAKPSAWSNENTQTGIRHMAFKVRDVDSITARLKAANVEFTLDPIDAIGGVRIAFFYDPDGAHIEIVANELNYHSRGPAYGTFPSLAPKGDELLFDHVAITVGDLDEALTYYGARLGLPMIGQLYFNNEQGFIITYLRAGNAVVELFSFSVPTLPTPDTSDPAVTGIRFATMQVKDVDDLVRNLGSAGVPILSADATAHSAFIEGPDHQLWQFME
jgi:catechol 2,3-dioxygenase-like lactoylglutathione lyase family enzyme